MAMMQPHGKSRKPMREVRDTRKPAYCVFILDTSSSMNDCISIVTDGETKQVRKIEELNRGLGVVLNSLRHFEASSVLYKIHYQIIELNSYGKALFPDFVPLSMQSEKICFEANGVTCLENSLTTLKTFLDPKHMPGCNRAVRVILMSDGYPTDVEGYVQDDEVYLKTISDFKNYLEVSGLKPNVDLSAIGIGEGACKKMLTAFADEGKYYPVEEGESLVQAWDFATRKSLVRMTTRAVKATSEAASNSDVGALTETIIVREVDVAKCLGNSCLACVDSCALSAIRYDNGMLTIQPDLCVGCGNCDDKCPVDAIQQISEDGCDDLV